MEYHEGNLEHEVEYTAWSGFWNQWFCPLSSSVTVSGICSVEGMHMKEDIKKAEQNIT